MTNIKELSESLDIMPDSLRKNLRRWEKTRPGIYLNSGLDPGGLPADFMQNIPDALADSIREHYAPHAEKSKGIQPVTSPVSDGILEKRVQECQDSYRAQLAATNRALEALRKEEKEAAGAALKVRELEAAIAELDRVAKARAKQTLDEAAPMFLESKGVAMLWLSAFVLADAVASAWIAFNRFQVFAAFAAPFFFVVGAAMGYSAVRNMAKCRGYEAGAWAWGFGLFQVALHVCAMGLLEFIKPGLSYTVGAAVIAIGIPLGTMGVAITFKKPIQ